MEENLNDYEIIIPPEDFENLTAFQIKKSIKNISFKSINEIIIVPDDYLYPIKLLIDHQKKSIFVAKDYNSKKNIRSNKNIRMIKQAALDMDWISTSHWIIEDLTKAYNANYPNHYEFNN